MQTLAPFTAMATKAASYFQSNLSLQLPLAYVGGWLGRRNLGDEALFHATQRLFPDFSLWHYDGSRTLATLLRTLPRTTDGLFAGGTLINRTPEYLDLARQFATEGRRLHFFGTGVADPDFWTGRGDFQNLLHEWKPLLADCGPIGVRGPRSAELLADAGVENVEVVGDPVLTFASEQPPEPVHEYSLGLNLGFDHGHQWGDPAEVKLQMLELARLALGAGWRIKWFVVFPRDLDLTRELARATGTESQIFTAYRHAEEFIREARRMALFVGMKLHATMLALCASVPSLMLEYDPKCLDFMRSIGQAGALIRTDRFQAVSAWERLQHWMTDRHERARAVHRAIQLVRLRQLELAQQLTQKIVALN